MVATINGFLNGVPAPNYRSGQTYLPWGMQMTGTNLNTSVNDLLYFPFYVWKSQTFSGARAWNGGAADNTENVRIGVYADDGTNGGPGTLEKDFGEITLTAASALRTLANSVTLPQGWHWIAFHSKSAANWLSMSYSPQITSAGQFPFMMSVSLTGHLLTVAPSATIIQNVPAGFFVNTAYGALASTAVAPTSEASRNVTGGPTGPLADVPLCGLYV